MNDSITVRACRPRSLNTVFRSQIGQPRAIYVRPNGDKKSCVEITSYKSTFFPSLGKSTAHNYQDLADVARRAMPFSPSGQRAKNTGLKVCCTECGRTRVLYAQHKVREEERERLFGCLLDGILYSCGTALTDALYERGSMSATPDAPDDAEVDKVERSVDVDTGDVNSLREAGGVGGTAGVDEEEEDMPT